MASAMLPILMISTLIKMTMEYSTVTKPEAASKTPTAMTMASAMLPILMISTLIKMTMEYSTVTKPEAASKTPTATMTE